MNMSRIELKSLSEKYLIVLAVIIAVSTFGYILLSRDFSDDDVLSENDSTSDESGLKAALGTKRRSKRDIKLCSVNIRKRRLQLERLEILKTCSVIVFIFSSFIFITNYVYLKNNIKLLTNENNIFKSELDNIKLTMNYFLNRINNI